MRKKSEVLALFDYIKRFWENAFPDPDLRYFSKLMALYLSEKAK